ncbi:hypothetical protein ACRAWC_19875 [Leifsonia sp. L25]|uniref:hypothetical protein n=1 Tax=Actinomycetes TaxID=1760 RepID=UPI003D694ED1
MVRVDPSGAPLGVVMDRLTADGMQMRVDDLRRLPDRDLELAVHIRGTQKEADLLLTELGRIDGVVSVKAGRVKG